MSQDDPTDEEPVAEWKLRAIAPPVAVVLAFLFHAWPATRGLQRIVFTMMVHELGHAVTAWYCGISAIPTLWKTLIPEDRGIVMPVVVAAFEAGLLYAGWMHAGRAAEGRCGVKHAARWWLIAVGVGLAVLQAIGTLGLSLDHAHQLITFGGDGGAMVLGTLLMGTFFAPRSSRLVRNGLRWGFLVIGSAAYADVMSVWWTARRDPDVIPFGEIEGVGLSDPSKLTDVHGWSLAHLIHRYDDLGIACAIALALAWAAAVYTARAAATRRT